MRTLRVIDFETTGLPPRAGIVEIGWTDVFIDKVISMEPVWHAELTNPGMPVEPEAEKVHGISTAMIQGARHPQQVLEELLHVDAFVAHNARFEKGFWLPEKKVWICTLKSSRQFILGSQAYNNTALRQHLGFDMREDFNPAFAMPAHRAGPDTYVTAFLLMDLLKRASFDDLVRVSGQAQLLVECSFKKYRGQPWEKVPSDYMRWLKGLPNLDEDVAYTIDYYLKLRGDTNDVV